jgi:Reverse transcriptase (RNA-dependent DNA polymerase)
MNSQGRHLGYVMLRRRFREQWIKYLPEKWKFVIPYLDDIIIFSKSREEHEKHLKIVLGEIRAHGLALNTGKCKFYKEEVKILGNIVSKGTIKPNPEKIQAVKNYQKPKQ